MMSRGKTRCLTTMLAVLAAALGGLTMPSVAAVEAQQLQASVLQELRDAGLAVATDPIPAFSWTLENKRPLRRPRIVEEHFEASPNGLASVSMTTKKDDGSVDRGEYISARGLIRASPDDASIRVAIEGMAIPLTPGGQFKFSLERDGVPVQQICHIGERSDAKKIHPALPGKAREISCEGEGRYAGMLVHVNSTVVYLEKLGVFLNRTDILQSPLGKFENSTRVLDFKLRG